MSAQICALLAVAMSLVGAQAFAASAAQSKSAAPPEPLTAEMLADHRGGYISAEGFNIGFGAVVRTFVDGASALETTLSWTPQGPVTQMSGPELGGVIAAGDPLAGLTGGQGLVLAGQGGRTAVLHDVSSGRLASFVINTADDRDVRQTIDVTLDLPGFQAVQQDMDLQRLQLRLQDVVGAALLEASGR